MKDMLEILMKAEEVNSKLRRFDMITEDGVYIKIRLRKLVAKQINIDTILRMEGAVIAVHNGTNEKHATILCLAPDTDDWLTDLKKHPIDGIFRGRRLN